MGNVVKAMFIGLSNNSFLNKQAKRLGFLLGADKFVAGVVMEEVVPTIKELNQQGISCTVDHLGEFVQDKDESIKAKQAIIKTIEIINQENLDCHLSVKLTQLGLDIDQHFCLENMKEILTKANEYNIFVNIDMEDYTHLEQTFYVLQELQKNFTNVGTVLQAYLYRTKNDMERLKGVRLRLVKGAYKEGKEVAFQVKREIDDNFVQLIKKRLLEGTFTSIATHDRDIIEVVKALVEENHIPKENFEFQMLYGFRKELQLRLAGEGYNFCTYIPFGEDWFGYYMRRLAERPQNLNLVAKDFLYNGENRLRKKPIYAVAIAASILFFWKKRRKRKEEKAS